MRRVAGTVAALWALSGCSSSNVDEVFGGTFEQVWTIEGEKEPAKCSRYGADRMRLILYRDDGAVHATEYAPCNAFRHTVDLSTQTYTAKATFLDSAGLPASRTVATEPFRIQSSSRNIVPIDFTRGDMTP
jgi:hypothetical protein